MTGRHAAGVDREAAMAGDLVLANAQLVLPGETVRGAVRVRGGMIEAIDHGAAVPRGAVDCEGDFLAPGLIELHTDNLERHIHPRPNVNWPHAAAIIAHDAELAGVGITTVFDAVRAGSINSKLSSGYGKYARALASEILAMRDAGALRISHHLHLRAEICSETLAEELKEFGPDDRIGIVSLMDHTPGQRQFADVSKLEALRRGRHGISSEEFGLYVAHLHDIKRRLGAKHEAAAVAAAKSWGAALASHDDSTAAQVAVSAGHGARMAEFPTTEEAARACRAAGIGVIMGAPNLVRGASHSGNVAAGDLARAGLVDMLSSDYVPAALLMGAVRLGEIWGDMARGMAAVTSAPAEHVGLSDRGAILRGRRADLARFRIIEGSPIVTGAWSLGRRVA